MRQYNCHYGIYLKIAKTPITCFIIISYSDFKFGTIVVNIFSKSQKQKKYGGNKNDTCKMESGKRSFQC